MKEDFLESFVKANREAFDTEAPNPALWEAIAGQLHDPKVRPLRTRRWQSLRVAAAVALILSVGTAMGFFARGYAGDPLPANVAGINAEFMEAEQYYQERIQRQHRQLTALSPGQDVEADLRQMDQAMAELRQELAKAPKGTQEQIVDNLLQQYRLKAELLERVLERLEEASTQQQDTQKHSSNDTISI